MNLTTKAASSAHVPPHPFVQLPLEVLDVILVHFGPVPADIRKNLHALLLTDHALHGHCHRASIDCKARTLSERLLDKRGQKEFMALLRHLHTHRAKMSSPVLLESTGKLIARIGILPVNERGPASIDICEVVDEIPAGSQDMPVAGLLHQLGAIAQDDRVAIFSSVCLRFPKIPDASTGPLLLDLVDALSTLPRQKQAEKFIALCDLVRFVSEHWWVAALAQLALADLSLPQASLEARARLDQEVRQGDAIQQAAVWSLRPLSETFADYLEDADNPGVLQAFAASMKTLEAASRGPMFGCALRLLAKSGMNQNFALGLLDIAVGLPGQKGKLLLQFVDFYVRGFRNPESSSFFVGTDLEAVVSNFLSAGAGLSPEQGKALLDAIVAMLDLRGLHLPSALGVQLATFCLNIQESGMQASDAQLIRLLEKCLPGDPRVARRQLEQMPDKLPLINLLLRFAKEAHTSQHATNAVWKAAFRVAQLMPELERSKLTPPLCEKLGQAQNAKLWREIVISVNLLRTNAALFDDVLQPLLQAMPSGVFAQPFPALDRLLFAACQLASGAERQHGFAILLRCIPREKLADSFMAMVASADQNLKDDALSAKEIVDASQ